MGGGEGGADGCATLGEQPGPSSLERGGKNVQKLYDSSQAGATHPASCCFPSWWSVKALEGLVGAQWWGVGGQAGLRRGLNCIGEFRQRGQVVSWMATSEAVPHRGRAGGGGRALGSQHGRKGALLFSGGWEGGERQEGRGRAGASRDGGAGGHDCGGEREAAVVSSVSGRSHQKLWQSHGQNSHLKHFGLF